MHILKTLIIVFFLFAGGFNYAADTIDINSADKETLMAVKGVGEMRAEAIIDYREVNGPFGSIEELMEVEGIGQATLDANRDILIVTSKK